MNVVNEVSMNHSKKNFAWWNINRKRGDGLITLWIPACWSEATERYQDKDDDWRLSNFIGCITYAYLLERVCLERANQRIRLNRPRCKPCCATPVTEAMFNHITHEFRT